MSVLRKVLIMTIMVIFGHIKFYSALLHSNVYLAKNNIPLTRPTVFVVIRRHTFRTATTLRSLKLCRKKYIFNSDYSKPRYAFEIYVFMCVNVLYWLNTQASHAHAFMKTTQLIIAKYSFFDRFQCFCLCILIINIPMTS